MFGSASLTAAVAIGATAIAAMLAASLPHRGSPFTAGAPLPDASAAATFTGTKLSDADEMVSPSIEHVDGVTQRRGQVTNGTTVESTDARAGGKMDFTFKADLHDGQGTRSLRS